MRRRWKNRLNLRIVYGDAPYNYINNGKLFVGAQLLASLGMTAIITISASLTLLMQKRNDLARYSHIVLNVALLGLFGWPAVTGVEIVQKIISKM